MKLIRKVKFLNLSDKDFFKKLTGVLLLVVVVNIVLSKPSFLKNILIVLKPIFVAFAISYLLDSFVCFLERKIKISRKKSIFLAVLMILFGVYFTISTLVPNLINSIKDLIESFNSQDIGQTYKSVLMSLGIDEQFVTSKINITGFINNFISSFTGAASVAIKMMLTGTSEVISFLVSFVISIYMVIDKQDLKARIKRLLYAIFDENLANDIVKVGNRANDIFSGFINGKIIDSIIIGVLCYIILTIFKLPYPGIIAIIVGTTNVIPYFGPIIGAIPSVMITLIQSPVDALWVLIIIIILQQFDGLFLGPLILGDKVGVSAFWIITGVTIGGAGFGTAGMFLGVPVLVLFKVVVEKFVERSLIKKGIDDFEKGLLYEHQQKNTNNNKNLFLKLIGLGNKSKKK